MNAFRYTLDPKSKRRCHSSKGLFFKDKKHQIKVSKSLSWKLINFKGNFNDALNFAIRPLFEK